MNAIKTTLFRIIPLTTLLCCIAFGISALFPTTNITYLTTKTLTNGSTYYYFDFQNYILNLNIDYMKDVILNTLDISGVKGSINALIRIWNDGYDLGDIGKTLITGFIVLGNIIILIINIIGLPLRLILGILLTLLSLIGININANSQILNVFKYIINNLIIPSIEVVW